MIDEETEGHRIHLPMVTYLAPSTSFPSWAKLEFGEISQGHAFLRFSLWTEKGRGCLCPLITPYPSATQMEPWLWSYRISQWQSLVKLFSGPFQCSHIPPHRLPLCSMSLTVPPNIPDNPSDWCSPEAAQVSHSHMGMMEKSTITQRELTVLGVDDYSLKEKWSDFGAVVEWLLLADWFWVGGHLSGFRSSGVYPSRFNHPYFFF